MIKQKILTITTFIIAVTSIPISPLLTNMASASREDIISDGVFGNYNAMSEAQIQNFIDSFPKSCLRPRNYPAGLSPVTWNEPLGYSTYGGATSPARIVSRAASMYKLNPQVLLATLEKEQGLVSGNSMYGGCVRQMYNSAMGYNCPDGSENALKSYPNIGIGDDQKTCVARESNATFSRQVNHAAWQLSFDSHRAYGDTSWLGDGSVPYVGFMTQGLRARIEGGPVAAYDGLINIDGTVFQVANGSTAALYNFTPHFNSFERIFTSWFGATHSVPIAGCNEATNTALVCVWKAKNNATGAEMITADYNTIVSWVNGKGYAFLGKSFFGRTPSVAPAAGNIPVYSLTQNGTGETFITADFNEYTSIGRDTVTWRGNGILFYADPTGSNTGYQVFRYYNPTNGQHMWANPGKETESYDTSGYIREGVAFTSLSPYRQETAAPAGQSNVYRFGGMPGNTHFWTQDIYERDRMISEGYNYEGASWKVTQSQTSMPVYRLYTPVLKQHLYTNDMNEVAVLSRSGNWQNEGVAWYGNTSGAPIYRLYSPSTHEHLYTADAYEKSFWVSRGLMHDEGVAWYQP